MFKDLWWENLEERGKNNEGNGMNRNKMCIFMFCWPCITIHPCNENQLDALFILSLFRESTSTCFGHICSPSSRVKLYNYNN